MTHRPSHISKMVLPTVQLGPPSWIKGKTFSMTFLLDLSPPFESMRVWARSYRTQNLDSVRIKLHPLTKRAKGVRRKVGCSQFATTPGPLLQLDLFQDQDSQLTTCPSSEPVALVTSVPTTLSLKH